MQWDIFPDVLIDLSSSCKNYNMATGLRKSLINHHLSGSHLLLEVLLELSTFLTDQLKAVRETP